MVATDMTIDDTSAGNLLPGGFGTDTLLGHWGADRLDGGSGNDILKGGGDNDVYVFDRRDGQDEITDRRDDWDFYSGGNDTIEFGTGIAFDHLRFSVTGNDLWIRINGSDQSVRIINGFRNENFRIEELRFADGSVKSYDDIMQVLSTGGPGNDSVVDDTRAGTLTGGAGNDTLSGYWGNDRIIGGTGNDSLKGGGDNDVYVFNRGDGYDTITDRRDDWDFYSGGYDAIEFGTGIALSDLNFIITGNDVTIAINGTDDRIRIINAFRNENFRIEELRFADGSVRTYEQLLQQLYTGGSGDDVLADDVGSNTINAGDGNDAVSAYWGNDRIIGGRGNDTLNGGGDNDVYVFNRGDGQDVITDRRDDYDFYSGGNDAIEFGAGISWSDLLLSSSGNDLVIRINGTDDRLRIVNGFTDVNYRVEELRFADGSIKTFTDIQAQVSAADRTGLTQTGQASDGSMIGTASG